MTQSSSLDVIVVGAGVAGAGVAAELSRTHRVALLERESRPGYHATGRSAALYSAIYGGDLIRALSRASRPFFLSPPQGFAESALLRPRGSLFVASAAQAAALEAFANLDDVAPLTRRVDAAQALAMCPLLRQDYIAQGVYEPEASDIEVDLLHGGYLRWFRANGGTLACDVSIEACERVGDHWRLRTGGGVFEAPVLINAAGAWADEVAALAGVAPIGVEPKRRTAVLVDPPAGVAVDSWPLVIDVEEQFYFKPDAGLLLLSPADETPSAPCDAQPDEMDVAIAVDRVEQATTLQVRRVRHRWAGLRTFTADRKPVAGFDETAEGFFWLVGQGGYGIQTAPALSRVAAALASGLAPPDDVAALGVVASDLAPARARAARRVDA